MIINIKIYKTRKLGCSSEIADINGNIIRPIGVIGENQANVLHFIKPEEINGESIDNFTMQLEFKGQSDSYEYNIENDNFYIPSELTLNTCLVLNIKFLKDNEVKWISLPLRLDFISPEETPCQDTEEESGSGSNPVVIPTKLSAFNNDVGYITKDSLSNDYTNIYKLDDYSYFAEYNSLDYLFAKDYFANQKIPLPNSGCSSIRNGHLFARNFDWEYNKSVEIAVHVPKTAKRYASWGVVPTPSDIDSEYIDNGKYNDYYKIIPFRIVDGINEKDVFVSENVVPTDLGVNLESVPLIEKRDEICNIMLIRYILDNFATAREAAEYIRDYVAIYPAKTLEDMHYETHFLIGDPTETLILEVIDNSVVITEDVPYMTNFIIHGVTFNENGKVYTPETQQGELNAEDYNGITPNGCGLERFNLIVDNYNNINTKEGMRNLLNRLSYTNAYKLDTNPFWFTEFVGINDLSVKSNPSDFEEVVNTANNMYLNRSRVPGEYYGTWHTAHSSIYDIENRKFYLITQESNNEYVFDLDGDISELLNQKQNTLIASDNIIINNNIIKTKDSQIVNIDFSQVYETTNDTKTVKSDYQQYGILANPDSITFSDEKIYILNNVSALELSINGNSERHFFIICGSTAPTITIPSTWGEIPFDAETMVEISVLNGRAVFKVW